LAFQLLQLTVGKGGRGVDVIRLNLNIISSLRADQDAVDDRGNGGEFLNTRRTGRKPMVP